MARLPSGTITLLFTDIEGSTRLSRQLGDRYGAVLADHRRLLRNAFVDHHGAEVDTQGDAFFVAFASARDAVSAAVDAQLAVREFANTQDVPLRVRIGIHTGEPQLTVDGYYVGVDLSRAARICAAAHGGQILLSAPTRALAGQEITVLDLGEHLLKDFDEPERLFQIVGPGLRKDFPAPRARAPGNLPHPRTIFYGRRRELDELEQVLTADARVVTLTGPGGVGKTRLALEVARRTRDAFRDGSFFISLAGVDETGMLAVIAQTLDVEERRDEALLEALQRRLGVSEVLLVLDNCEAAVEAAPKIAALIDACPKVKALATSRERLNLLTEQEYRLAPLQNEDAGALFAARVAVARSDPAVAADDPAVVAICRRLEGLPLAIELAAAHTRVLPLATVLERLEQRLSFLGGGARDLPERQRTLAATIEWSYTTLDPTEQTLFLRLAVFAGGASLEAAESVAPPEMRTLDVVTSLCDKSLMTARTTPDGSPRFWMLETIREYALARLAELGLDPQARRAQAGFVLGIAERAARDLEGPSQARALRELAHEHENLRAALLWAVECRQHDVLLRLAAALWRFWFVRGHLTEGRRWLGEAVSAGAARDETLARALFGASVLAAAAGDIAQARSYAETRLDVARDLGSDEGIASAQGALANIVATTGDIAAAADLYAEAAEHARRAAAAPALAGIMNNLGYLRLLTGEAEAAVDPCTEAAALFEGLVRLDDAAGAWLNVANAQIGLHRLNAAAEALHRSLERYLELEHPDGVSYCVDVAAVIALQAGDLQRAAMLAAAASSVRRQTAGTPPPFEQRQHDETVAALRERLPPAAYASACANGSRLDLAAAAAAARSVAVNSS